MLNYRDMSFNWIKQPYRLFLQISIVFILISSPDFSYHSVNTHSRN